ALGLLAVVFVLSARKTVFGRRWVFYWPRLAALAFSFALIGGGALTISEGLRDKILQSVDLMVVDKLTTDAGKRGEVELNALRVFWDSYMLGGGLGSNECFTVGGYILSNTGIIGGILVSLFGWSTLKLAKQTIEHCALPAHFLTDIKSLLLFLWGLVLAGI